MHRMKYVKVTVPWWINLCIIHVCSICGVAEGFNLSKNLRLGNVLSSLILRFDLLCHPVAFIVVTAHDLFTSPLTVIFVTLFKLIVTVSIEITHAFSEDLIRVKIRLRYTFRTVLLIATRLTNTIIIVFSIRAPDIG